MGQFNNPGTSTVAARADHVHAADVLPSAGANGVNTAAIQDGAVTSAKIADGTIATGDIADQAVTATKIANDTITAAQIAANAVGSSELADNAVDTNAIANDAVTTAKIADAAVTSAKIGALTTKGDLLARDGSGAVRLPVGTDGQVLVADAAASAGVKWGAEPAVKATVGNLLTANQAKPTTTGAYTCYNGAEGAAGVYTASGGDLIVLTPQKMAVTPGDTITAQATLTTVGCGGKCYVVFYTAAGGDAGGHTFGSTVAAGTTAGVSSVTTVVPATAATVEFYANYHPATVGQTVTVTKATVHRGAAGVWQLPGLPIPNLGIRPNPADTSQVQIWNDATATWITV